MLTCIIIKNYWKLRIQVHVHNLHSMRRAHIALTAPYKTPQRCHNVHTARFLVRRSNAKPRRCLWACTNDCRCMALLAIAQRAHSFAADCTARTQPCWRLHSAHTTLLEIAQRAHSFVGDCTASTQLCWRLHCAYKTLLEIAQRAHSFAGDCTARTQLCWRLHSAYLGDLPFLGRCWSAVWTPVWCYRPLNFV